VNLTGATGPRYSDGVVELGQFETSDIAAHLAGEDEETARRFGWWPETSTAETVRRAFEEWAAQWQTDGPIKTFAVRAIATGTLVGGCQLRRQADGAGHVSYWTGAAYRGRGYASRALVLLRHHAVSDGVTALESHITADNHGSRTVSEHAGFVLASSYRDDGGAEMVRYVWSAERSSLRG
jgi:RimJ/RimL family protein N-acetyltransferase